MTQVPFDTNMWFLLIVFTFILLVLWGLRILKTGKMTIAWNGTTKRLGVLVLASLVSLMFTGNKTESILTPFGVGTFLSLFLIASIGAAFLDEKARAILRWVLMTTVSLAGLLAIYQFVGLTKLIEINASLMTMFIVMLPIMIGEALHKKHVAIVMSVVCLGGLALTAYQVLPIWGSTTLPFWVNWEILLENYKNLKQLMVGVGAQNFLGAFTAGRPATINMTALWNTRFVAGSSLAFHIATVYGLAGVVAVGYFLSGFFKVVPFSIERNDLAKLVAAFAFLFLPPSFPALVVITTILIISESTHPISLARGGLAKLIAIAVLLVVGAASYGLYRAYGAEFAFGKSLQAFDNREGTNAYNLQIQAITLNPNVARFHMAYAQTNLALANAIATSSADRQTTTQLIQQAIREAKIAIGLAPTNILAWENIASVYQTLSGVAQGADLWTIAAYQQAMQLDPTNPTIRLRLGGAYVGQQKFDEAIASYNAASSLKPDYANVYYNMGFAYREQKKYLQASQALLQALKYVTPGSADEGQAKKELNEVTQLLTEAEKQSLNAAPEATAMPTPDTAPLSPLP